MTSRATPAHLKAEGFKEPSQFGTDVAGLDAYLQGVLDIGAAWARSRMGATAYAAVASGSDTEVFVIRAELAKAKAALWRRRAAFFDSASGTALTEFSYLDRREYLANADTADAEAEAAIAEALRLIGANPLEVSGGMSIGHLETGPYPLASTSALNA